MLTKVAAIEYGCDNIRINTINPGLTRTDLGSFIFDNKRAYKAFMEKTPLRTYAEPEDIADSAVFLASGEARFISAAALFVDGGITPEGYPDAFRIALNDEKRYEIPGL
jgi:NAD(P)-dependent dehydrogenase (short-subunit alcohol dehydrogenase family)